MIINNYVENKNSQLLNNDDFEKISGSKSRKVFGKEIKSENYTEANFVGAIVYVGPCCDYKNVALSNQLRVFCTASIINEYYLLTTSLCLYNFKKIDKSNFIIIFHSDPLEEWRKNYDKEIEYRKIENYKMHEEYDPKWPLKNNVGTIKMNEPLNLNDTLTKIKIPYISYFRPYCKDEYEVDVSDVYDDKCYLYSYGKNQQNKSRLNRFDSPLMDPRDCRRFDSNFDPKEFVCSGPMKAFSWVNKNLRFNNGNYGGPLVCVEKNFKDFNDFTKHQVVAIAVEAIVLPYQNKNYILFYHFASIKFFRDWIADNSKIIINKK